MKRFFQMFFCLMVSLSFSKDYASASTLPQRNFAYTERTDLRRYDNGRYKGLFSRELRSFVTCREQKNDVSYSAIFYVMEQTKRNMVDVNQSVNVALRTNFSQDENGNLVFDDDMGYPSFRNFPAIPKGKLVSGDTWTSESIRCVDPMENGQLTLMNILVSYTFVREDTWKGRDVYVVNASWATRYSPSSNEKIGNTVFDPKLARGNGSHNATLYIDPSDCSMILCRDTVDETFVYGDGATVAYKGTINLFTDWAASVDRPSIKKTFDDLFKDEKFKKDVKISEGESGLVLSLKNLQFQPDTAELLPGESERLDLIAQILKKSPGSTFLVTGHATSTGNPKGEQKVSEDRAKTIVKELVRRGIDGDKLVCRGEGSNEPVADNSTPEGKAENRRVEITILE